MKKGWIVGTVVFLLIAGLLLPQIAADLHYFFSKDMDSLTMNPLEGWAEVLAGGKPLQFYLLLAAIVGLLLLWVIFTSSYLNYRSGKWVVTPDIITPCADGQGQFGTARWLPPERFRRYFGVWTIDQKSDAFQALLAAGKEEKERITNANIKVD